MILGIMRTGEGISMVGLAGTLVVDSGLVGGEVSARWTKSRETKMALATVNMGVTQRGQPKAMQDELGCEEQYSAQTGGIRG